jgi:hypothetical protein
MRFEVPQFIEIEDKIFGPLTWRQFLYLGGGLGMSVALILTLPFILGVLLAIPLAVIALALAFYPVNNRPFSYFLEAIVNYLKNNRLYLWRKKSDVVHSTFTPSMTSEGMTAPSVQEPVTPRKKEDISSLSRKLELQALQKNE